jgi:hypothetical protein
MSRATFNALGCLALSLLLSWAVPVLAGGGWEGVRIVLAFESGAAAFVAFLLALAWLIGPEGRR